MSENTIRNTPNKREVQNMLRLVRDLKIISLNVYNYTSICYFFNTTGCDLFETI